MFVDIIDRALALHNHGIRQKKGRSASSGGNNQPKRLQLQLGMLDMKCRLLYAIAEMV